MMFPREEFGQMGTDCAGTGYDDFHKKFLTDSIYRAKKHVLLPTAFPYGEIGLQADGTGQLHGMSKQLDRMGCGD